MTILDKIIANTQEEVARRKTEMPLINLRAAVETAAAHQPSFYNSLRSEGINIIAEIKKASPSKGLICADFDPAQIASEYEQGGAAAISVLTDEKFFQGRLTFLDDVAAAVNVPLLRKDFIIDEYQVYEAALHNASAILLLASALPLPQMRDFLTLAREIGLDALVEVHNVAELETALKTDARVIGVNNRDLHSFIVDLKTSLELVLEIPADKLKVSESGIFTHDDIRRLLDAGFDAFLIGESLMQQLDRVTALKALRGI